MLREVIKDATGRDITVYDSEMREKFLAEGKSEKQFFRSPPWAMAQFGWIEPRWVLNWSVTGNESDFWESRFRTKAVAAPKLGFYEIFTDGMGPLTGPEVRDAERRAGVMIDDSTAVRAYNTKLELDEQLFMGAFGMAELAAQIPDDAGRLEDVHAYVTKMLEAEPVYFGFRTDKYLSEDVQVVEGVRLVTPKDAAKVPTVGIALMGRHARKRDVFDLTQFLGGAPNPAAEGRRAMQLPGRDRAFRVMGVAALGTYLWSPALVLWQVQIAQLLEGRAVTMPAAPVPPGMLGLMA